MIATEQLTIRHYMPGDILRHLAPEYAHMELTPDLCWVAEGPVGEVMALVLATGGHQTAVLLRVAALPDAPRLWLVVMLRYVIRELADRDFKLILACLGAARAEELKLARMMERAGGKLAPIAGYVGALPLALAGRW